LFGTSGFDISDVIAGRPYGGCAILWLANLYVDIHFVTILIADVCVQLEFALEVIDYYL
jgi:hypothetical protein